MAYCEDYPCCGHTPEDPCERMPYDEPGYYEDPRNLYEHDSPEYFDYLDSYDDEPECNHEETGEFPDLDYLDNGVKCPWCGTTLLGPHTGDKRTPWGEIEEYGTFVVNYG